jgi:hypothetical protein
VEFEGFQENPNECQKLKFYPFNKANKENAQKLEWDKKKL